MLIQGSTAKNRREKRIQLFQKVCKENGIKVTPQRLEIFLAVIDAPDHPSAEEVLSRVRRKLPTVSLDTVYRTLSRFDEKGLISKVHFLDEKTRFDPNTDRHHHLVCVQCKGVMDFLWPEVDAMAMPEEVLGWGRVEERHVLVRGLCSDCSSSRDHHKPPLR